MNIVNIFHSLLIDNCTKNNFHVDDSNKLISYLANSVGSLFVDAFLAYY
jgi:hypothetical protein